MKTLSTLLLTCLFILPASAKYSGGTGEPNDPYQIATSADLIALGETPEDYDKHFILTADIDLDPNLPGRKVFDKAVIAPDTDKAKIWFQGPSFTGVFDGGSHTISHVVIKGSNDLGLFGGLGSTASVSNLGMEAVDVSGTGNHVGGLVGGNDGSITSSYSSGSVSGDGYVGGLVGGNDGSISTSYSSGSVSGRYLVGGLVGGNGGSIATSSSSGSVSGDGYVGGLVGGNGGSIATSYSSGSVSGTEDVGGLVGSNTRGNISSSYSTGSVSGTEGVGGLVGYNEDGSISTSYSTGLVSGTEDVGGLVGACFSAGVTQGVWDTETAGLSESAGGVGLTTAEMMAPYMLGLNGFASDPNWVLDAGRGYPRLAWEGMPGAMIAEPNVDWLEGYGSREDPYRIQTAEQLIFLGRASALCESHFILDTDIDLNPNLPGRHVFEQAVIPAFRGVFDGRGHVISNLRIEGSSDLGLFGCLTPEAEVKNVGVVDVNITGSDGRVGALVGYNSDGRIATSYSTGLVSGTKSVGGLVGTNDGSITTSCSSSTVSGTAVYSPVGGLVGDNENGNIAMSYSTGKVSGHARHAGGLVGHADWESHIGHTTSSFWDIQTSGQTRSYGGKGKTTAEMQDVGIFLNAGWDFVDETLNGTGDYWQISPGEYPRLYYRGGSRPLMPEGLGTAEQPYLIRDARDLGTVWFEPLAHYRLAQSVDLSGITCSMAVIPWFGGTFDGDGHVISNLHIQGDSYLGLFGQLDSTASVCNLGLEAVEVSGTADHVGGLVGFNNGSITNCYSSSSVSGGDSVGGLVGDNGGSISASYSTGLVSGRDSVGGLVGDNGGSISASYSTGLVSGRYYVGGLVGSGSAARVTSSFWDIQTSGQATSAGGTGKTTAEMQTGSTFLEAGWDFVGETANGTDDIWWILEGKDYPRLWWELEEPEEN